MRTLTTLFVLLLVTSTSNADIISIMYYEDEETVPLNYLGINISITDDHLKLRGVSDSEAPTFGANLYHRDMTGYWIDENDFYFEFRPRWHRWDWSVDGQGIATPEGISMTSTNAGLTRSRSIENPDRVNAVRFVPEPSGLTLLALGGLFLAGTRRRNAGAWRGN